MGRACYITEAGDNRLVHITDTGKELLELSGTYTFSTPRTWDERWRIVLFDIPQDHAELRHELRRVLERVGFLQLQQSVYAFPYAVPYLERMFTDRHFPLSQVTYCTVDTILYDATLRKHFKLPLARPARTTNI
jgi:DNA-binding transcriptional regulator PaaX